MLDPGQTHRLSKLNSDLFLGIQSKDSGQDCMLQKAVSQFNFWNIHYMSFCVSAEICTELMK